MLQLGISLSIKTNLYGHLRLQVGSEEDKMHDDGGQENHLCKLQHALNK